jgi:hypothetical protein
MSNMMINSDINWNKMRRESIYSDYSSMFIYDKGPSYQGYYNLCKIQIFKGNRNIIPLLKDSNYDQVRLLKLLNRCRIISENSCLVLACKYGHVNTIDFFLDIARIHNYDVCFAMVTTDGRYKALKYLSSRFQCTNIFSLFFIALRGGWTKIVMYILNRYSSINYIHDKDVAMYACINNMFPLINRMIRKGSRLFNTLFPLLLESVRNNNVKMVDFLFRNYSPVNRLALNQPYEHGNIIIHHECLICGLLYGETDLLRILLNNSTIDDLLNMRVIYAALSSNKSVIKLFKSYIDRLTSKISITRLFLHVYITLL